MRTFGMCLMFVALSACALANGSGYFVRDGDNCRALRIGDRFACAPLGGEATVVHTLEEGETWPSTTCASLPQCKVSSSNFTIFSVSHEEGLDTLVTDLSEGIVSASATQATAVGSLASVAFRSPGSGTLLRYIDEFDDGSFLTTVGLCDFGTTCTQGGFTFRAVRPTSGGNFTALEATIAAKATGLGGAQSPVTLDLGHSYAFSATSVTDFFVSNGVTVAEADLANVALSVPPHVSLTELTLKNADEEVPELVAKLSFRDFETYREVPCHHEGDEVECEFSFSTSFDFSSFVSNFFFSFSLEAADLATDQWEEQAFSLFALA